MARIVDIDGDLTKTVLGMLSEALPPATKLLPWEARQPSPWGFLP